MSTKGSVPASVTNTVIAYLRRLTPTALAVMAILLFSGFAFRPSRVALSLSNEVPTGRLAFFAALLVMLGYAGAASIERSLRRDVREKRKR